MTARSNSQSDPLHIHVDIVCRYEVDSDVITRDSGCLQLGKLARMRHHRFVHEVATVGERAGAQLRGDSLCCRGIETMLALKVIRVDVGARELDLRVRPQ